MGRLKTHGTCPLVHGSSRTAFLDDDDEESGWGCSGWKTPAERTRLFSTKYAVLVYVLLVSCTECIFSRALIFPLLCGPKKIKHYINHALMSHNQETPKSCLGYHYFIGDSWNCTLADSLLHLKYNALKIWLKVIFRKRASFIFHWSIEALQLQNIMQFVHQIYSIHLFHSL